MAMKTAILSWHQNDGNRGFSKDQLEGKQLSPTFRPGALVVFRAKVKLGAMRQMGGGPDSTSGPTPGTCVSSQYSASL